jgi:hypothetical protein
LTNSFGFIRRWASIELLADDSRSVVMGGGDGDSEDGDILPTDTLKRRSFEKRCCAVTSTAELPTVKISI